MANWKQIENPFFAAAAFLCVLYRWYGINNFWNLYIAQDYTGFDGEKNLIQFAGDLKPQPVTDSAFFMGTTNSGISVVLTEW